MVHNSRFFAVYRTYYLNKKSFLTILQNIKCLKLFVFVWFLGFYKFFISYSAGWQSTLTHCHGYSLPIPIIINAFYSIVDPKFTGKIFANLYNDCHKPDSHQMKTVILSSIFLFLLKFKLTANPLNPRSLLFLSVDVYLDTFFTEKNIIPGIRSLENRLLFLSVDVYLDTFFPGKNIIPGTRSLKIDCLNFK